MTAGKHGYGPYTRGCRCDTCRQAAREYRAAWRLPQQLKLREARRTGKDHEVVGIKHGLSGYTNYSCRCQECRAAKADADAKRPTRQPSRLGLTVSIESGVVQLNDVAGDLVAEEVAH